MKIILDPAGSGSGCTTLLTAPHKVSRLDEFTFLTAPHKVSRLDEFAFLSALYEVSRIDEFDEFTFLAAPSSNESFRFITAHMR